MQTLQTKIFVVKIANEKKSSEDTVSRFYFAMKPTMKPLTLKLLAILKRQCNLNLNHWQLDVVIL